MNNFKVIFKILKSLEKAMDYEEFDIESISPERLEITKERWEKIIIMLTDSGYIKGVSYEQCLSDYSPHIVEPIHPAITLLGLEYLNENSIMKKMADTAKGIATVASNML